MTRRIAVLPLLVAAWLALGCPRNAPETPVEATPALLLSHAAAPDPRAASQMLEGFYPLEQRLWCWTTKEFAVALAPPPSVDGFPVELSLRFAIPDVIISSVGPVTLTASIGGTAIGSQRYEQASFDLEFRAEISDELLAGKGAVVEFELDKSMIANEEPRRELGVVFLSAALQ